MLLALICSGQTTFVMRPYRWTSRRASANESLGILASTSTWPVNSLDPRRHSVSGRSRTGSPIHPPSLSLSVCVCVCVCVCVLFRLSCSLAMVVSLRLSPTLLHPLTLTLTNSLYAVFLDPIVVAPLGAAALVFNFIFAYWLVGTKITNQDLIGTFLIIIGAVLIPIFGDTPKEGKHGV